VFGVWLHGSYKESPTGGALAFTHVLLVISLSACLLGALQLLRLRRYALAGWLALMLLVWIAFGRYATTWVQAKALMITSPAVVLIAWAGVASLRAPAGLRLPRAAARVAAVLLALVLLGGELASDAAQYHSSNLAPTARYQELASINRRFAGRGPTLFTDFDEYSMYELRDLDVGGPDFVYPPPALAGLAGGYGRPVDLNRASPAALGAYSLIVTRRDPTAAPPPYAYRLLWQGHYYEVWGRRPGVRPAIRHLTPQAGVALSCQRIQRLAGAASAERGQLIAAATPELVRVELRRASHPRGWGRQRAGFAMKRPGTLASAFQIPAAGEWDLWLQGQFMPQVSVRVDGQLVSSISGQLAGNSLVPDTITPVALRLSSGAHRLTVTRGGFSLAPGNGGAAVLDSVFLTPARAGARDIVVAHGDASSSLCGRALQWIEIVPR
jgi:hypothetical protein